MSIKKDGTGKRWVEMEILVPGTPEEVWQAMATGAGNTAWFTRATIEERVGGALRFDFGPEMGSSGEVTVWEPPHRFGYVESEWSEGAPPVATEITITSRSGGQCTMRMVHSLFTASDQWDDEMEGFENGWPGFFEVLRIYLRYFAGKEAASFQAMATGIAGDTLPAWKRLTEELGLAGANAGEHRTMSRGPQILAGTVETTRQDAKVRNIILRLDAPSPGIAIAGLYTSSAGIHAGVSVYVYGDGAAAKAAESGPLWNDWMKRTFGPRPSA
jgi:uncharacterized protein YndB with AHSA1/START domain